MNPAGPVGLRPRQAVGRRCGNFSRRRHV